MKVFEFRNVTFLLLGIVLMGSCKKDSGSITLESEVWVESKSRTDTIAFSDNLMFLTRPKVQTGAYMIPKIGAGPYTYKNLKDSIELNYSLSSLFSPKRYAFKVENNKLYIADFYEKTPTTLVFERLK